MRLIEIYKCLCDETRLRILHLLTQGPLCVCHFQEILEIGQVQISKHLAYLRERKMVVATRHNQWVIYSLPLKQDGELELQMRCLQDCAPSDPIFKADLKRLKKVKSECSWVDQALASNPDK